MKVDLRKFLEEQTSKMESSVPQKLAHVRLGTEKVIEGLAALSAQGFMFEVHATEAPPKAQEKKAEALAEPPKPVS